MIEADLLKFEDGRCHLEGCPARKVGHWNEVVTMTLHTNKARTEFWYESSCAPGHKQPTYAVPERHRDMIARLKARPETREALASLGVAQPLF